MSVNHILTVQRLFSLLPAAPSTYTDGNINVKFISFKHGNLHDSGNIAQQVLTAAYNVNDMQATIEALM